MVGWHHRLNRHEFEQTPGDSEGKRSLGCWSPWGCKELDVTINFTFTFHFHALEKEMATHSSVLAWRIPGTGEPGGLPSMGSHRVGHNWSDLAGSSVVNNSPAKVGVTGATGSIPGSGRSSGQRRLAGYSPWGHIRVEHDWAFEHVHSTLGILNYHGIT